MAIDLIYHTVETASGGPSPFDEAITALSLSPTLCIACPYLSLKYIKRLIKNSHSWRILTDVEEWLISHNNKARKEIVEFITSNLDHIHHYKNLHAKVIIAEKSAIVGSANFTEKGVLNRAEMSVRIDQEEQLEELCKWFDRLWNESASVDAEELKAFLRLASPKASSEINRPPISLTSKAPRIKAKWFVPQPRSGEGFTSNIDLDAKQRLVERIKLAPNKTWINSYFDLVRELIEFTGLTEDDPRLVMSIPKRLVLPVTINRRYVLSAFRRGKVMIRFILGARFAETPEVQSGSFYVSPFNPHADETEEEAPYIAAYRSVLDPGLTRRVKQEWRKAVLFEMNHGKKSSFRHLHEPIVYKAAVDLEYRESILKEAFPIQAT